MKEMGECVLAPSDLTRTLCIWIEESQVITSLFVVKLSSPWHLPASQAGWTVLRYHLGIHQRGSVSLPREAVTGELHLFSFLPGTFPVASRHQRDCLLLHPSRWHTPPDIGREDVSTTRLHTRATDYAVTNCRGRSDALHSQERSSNIFIDINHWFNNVW